MKRVFDIIVATLGILALALPMLGVAFLVRCSSPGPIIFRQTRVGRGGDLFQILKFRSMRVGMDGLAITRADDDRITPIGRVLRKLKLDEIPQLFNVLVGEMSLVGPRPEVPRYMDLYSPAQRNTILSVRPGVTDSASIHFRHEEDMLPSSQSDVEDYYIEQIMPIKFEYYKDYINNMSIITDLKIISRTMWSLAAPKVRLTGKGAPGDE